MDTDTAWEHWGSRDPYFGVLTNPKYRSAALSPEGKAEFFAIGVQHVSHVLDILRRHISPDYAPQRVLDFGCGVGRLVIPFAEVSTEVVGLDISSSMLAEAQRNCDARGLTNVLLLKSDDSLSAAEGLFDLVHSCIVLQHIQIPRGRELFAKMVQKIRPGGSGAIHVTFGWTAHAQNFGQVPPPVLQPPSTPLSSLKRLVSSWRSASNSTPQPAEGQILAESVDPEMQMNYYNLSELTFILQSAGVQQLLTELTDHGGALGAFMFFRIPG